MQALARGTVGYTLGTIKQVLACKALPARNDPANTAPAVDTYFIDPFKDSGVPSVEPRSGPDTFEKGLGDLLASLDWL
jgi:hypothetical protein